AAVRRHRPDPDHAVGNGHRATYRVELHHVAEPGVPGTGGRPGVALLPHRWAADAAHDGRRAGRRPRTRAPLRATATALSRARTRCRTSANPVRRTRRRPRR